MKVYAILSGDGVLEEIWETQKAAEKRAKGIGAGSFWVEERTVQETPLRITKKTLGRFRSAMGGDER